MEQELNPAFQKNQTLLDDIRQKRARRDEMHLWWLGQSGFLVAFGGKTVLFDPYLSDSLTRKYADTVKPHVRLTERVVDPAELDFIDIVTSSHNHTDHLDPETLRPIFEANPRLRMVAPRANRKEVLERSGASAQALVELNDGESAAVDGIAFHGIAAAHNELETDAAGDHRFMGFVARWGGLVLYHSGDCLPYPGLVERLRPFSIDLAFLPINGNRPERRIAGNFDGNEAAALARDAAIQCVIPCHYDLFAFNTVSPEEFVRSAREMGLRHQILRNGEGWRFCS